MQGNETGHSFYVVLADGIMEIPQERNLSWITLFHAMPEELVEKRPAYLELPRNIHQLLHSEEYCKMIQSEAFLELVWSVMPGQRGNSFRCPERVSRNGCAGKWCKHRR